MKLILLQSGNVELQWELKANAIVATQSHKKAL